MVAYQFKKLPGLFDAPKKKVGTSSLSKPAVLGPAVPLKSSMPAAAVSNVSYSTSGVTYTMPAPAPLSSLGAYTTPGVVGSCPGCASEPSFFDQALAFGANALGLAVSAPAIAVGAVASLAPDVHIGDKVEGPQSNGVSNTTLIVVAVAAFLLLRRK